MTIDDFVLSIEEQKAIDHKSLELYEKRITPYATNLSASQKETILNLQKIIFTLDYYFEHNEVVKPEVLNFFWAQCDKFLADLGISKYLRKEFLKDIKDYAEIETSIRNGKKLAEYDIKQFYFKKSCDVRLQRHLIRWLIQQKPTSSEEEITKDILEEIEDDVDDIEEDKLTPLNGNRFLEVISGENNRVKEYIIFVDSQDSFKDLKQRIINKIRDLPFVRTNARII